MIDDQLRAKRLFHQALELPASERSAFLRRQCADDLKLRNTVKELLRIDERPRVFLDSSVAHEAVAAATIGANDGDDPLIGATIGRYKLLREIGAGGMGTVYEAFQEAPRRRVALKLLRAFVSIEVRKRFRLEVEVLGRLRHPNIAQVYDAGTHLSSLGDVPFFALEFVQGARTITEFARQQHLDIEQRVQLFAIVCDAVQYAHQRGVIHRDLKPTNILVDEEGEAKVIDFGVARIDDHAFTAAATLNTNTGQIIGTLRYMSPEQCSGNPGAVDMRSDVYALGVVLYELLSGKMPYDLSSTSSAWQIPTIIRESLPAPLSSINARLRGDIETIVLKALAKEPVRRYQSVEALGADLRRYLNREPIEARRDHIVYVLRKSVVRYRKAIAVIFVFLLLATASAITFGFLYENAEAARRETAERNEELRVENYFALISLAEGAIERNATVEARELLDRCPDDLRNWEWRYLRNALDDSALSITFPEDLFAMAVSPDESKALITNGIDDEENVSLALYDIAAGAIVWRKELGPAFITLADWSDDGSSIIVSMWEERAFTVYDAVTGDVDFAHVLPHDSYRAVFLPGDERVVMIGFNGLVQIWDIVAQELVSEFRVLGAVNGFAVSNDGRQLAIGTNAGSQGAMIALYDLETGDERWRIENAHAGHAGNLVFTSDDISLYSAGGNGSILRLNARTGAVVQRFFNADYSGEKGLSISPDDRLLAVPTQRGIALWDARTVRTLRLLKGHRPQETRFLDNNRLRTIGYSTAPSVYFWQLDARTANIVMPGGSNWLDGIALTSDGRNIILKEEGGRILSRSLETGKIEQAQQCGGRYSGLAVSPDGSQLACLALRGPLKIFSLPSLKLLHELSLQDLAWIDVAGTMVAWHPSGEYVFVPAADEIAVIDTRTEKIVQRLSSPHASRSTIVALAVDNAGGMMATSDNHGGIALYEIEQDEEHPVLSVRTTWQGHETTAVPHGMMRAIAFSPNGKILATGSFDQTIRLWDIETGRELHTLRGHEYKIGEVCFSSDGSRLFSVAAARVCIWDTITGRLVSMLPNATMHLELNPANDSLIVSDLGVPRDLRVFNVADR